MNKELGTTLLITEQTHEPIAESFECRAMPETKVKGKSRPLRVYEVLSARQAGSPTADKPPTPQTTPTSPPPARARAPVAGGAVAVGATPDFGELSRVASPDVRHTRDFALSRHLHGTRVRADR